jgi:hypothetical protein
MKRRRKGRRREQKGLKFYSQKGRFTPGPYSRALLLQMRIPDGSRSLRILSKFEKLKF